MNYDIPAKSTEYDSEYHGRVLFRSRLEAHWAAFFDINGIWWKYEPHKIGRWLPDFGVRLLVLGRYLVDIYVEVKPVEPDLELTLHEQSPDWYEKAYQHRKTHLILLLGSRPENAGTGIGHLLDLPVIKKLPYDWMDVNLQLMREGLDSVSWEIASSCLKNRSPNTSTSSGEQ